MAHPVTQASAEVAQNLFFCDPVEAIVELQHHFKIPVSVWFFWVFFFQLQCVK